MKRILEPELMDAPAQVEAYARADFSAANQLFLTLYQERFGNPGAGALVLDLGCGPADIPIRFARAFPNTFLHGVDASRPMVEEARRSVQQAGLAERIRVFQKVLPHEDLPAAGYDVLLSNSLLHHLHDPGGLWFMVATYARKYAEVCVMDLMRPADEPTARGLVDTYAPAEGETLRSDFFNSLRAAFHPDEVREQLRQAGLPLNVEIVSDRHMLVSGRL